MILTVLCVIRFAAIWWPISMCTATTTGTVLSNSLPPPPSLLSPSFSRVVNLGLCCSWNKYAGVNGLFVALYPIGLPLFSLYGLLQ
jgi:hypothetical protein